MNATFPAPAVRPRPTLDVEAKSRRNCRNNLRGMACTDAAGHRRTILDTGWAPGTVLTVQVERGGPFLPASGFTLAGPWAFKCCRGRLDVNGRPRRKGAR